MVISLVRTVILYILIIAALRLTGKRQLGELQPSELVLSIMISDLACVPMANTGIPLLGGIIPMVAIVSMEIILSFIILKSNKARRFITGQPSIIISKGVVNQREMARLRINIDDLMEELRQKNIVSIEEVNYAILETTGKLSVFPRNDLYTVQRSDLNIGVEKYTSMPSPIIADGELDRHNLKKLGFNEAWLKRTLKNNGIASLGGVLYMTADENGKVFIIKRDRSGGNENESA
ncbi:MAG: DUF421 domain-containing protein [Clostridia bacterium]|nr:DUF421 domain-containing protein [Clostridia bacterium]